MAQQTAVEWLIEQVKSKDWQDMFVWNKEEVFEQAKQMENEQLKNMYLKGIENYDPTFKRKSQWTEVDNMTKRLK
jgi:hypothetical protein